MELTPQLIEAFKVKMNDPAARGDHRLMKDCIVAADEPTDNSEMFDLIQTDFPNLPKLVFYIIMDETYPMAKTAQGTIGHMAKYIPNHSTS